MKKTSILFSKVALALLCLVMFNPFSSKSQNGPACDTYTNVAATLRTGLGANTVRSVSVSGSTVYAATDNGLSISTDGGASFTNKTTTNGLGNNIVFGVYASGSTVYAATNGGLSISTDGGASFTNYTTSNGLRSNFANGVYASGSTVYAAIDGGLSISTDGGTSFTNKTITNGLGSNIVKGVYASGSTVYAATNGGLSISTDGGASFTNKTTTNGLGDNLVIGVYASGSMVYAATNGGLSISTDGGASFTNKTTANGLGSNAVNGGVYASGSTVYAPTAAGLSISTDGGASFTNKTTTNGLGNNNSLGVYVSGSTIYAATSGGLSISTDAGASFLNTSTTKPSGSGLGNNNVKGVYASGSTVYAATSGGLSISTDGGASFTNKTTANGLGNNNVNGVYASGSTIYAATNGGGLSISTDGGASFTNKTTTNGLGNNSVKGVYASVSTIYAATNGGLSISTDGGAIFTNYTTSNGLGNNIVNGVYASGSTVYVATGNGLSISTDGGTSFTNKTTTNGLGDNYVNGVYASGSTVYAATINGLSISTDGGASFTNKNTTNGLGNNNVRGVYASGSTVYVATSGGLSISTDSGAIFTNYTTSNGLGNNIVNGVYASGSTVYVATSGGLSSCSSISCTPTTSTQTVSACGSYVWNGTTYTTSGAKTFTTTNAAGCDSTITLNLTINNATSSSETQSACGSYLWNGTTYTTSGAKTFTTTNATGCDSVVTLNLTIKNATSSSVTQTACGSYLWNGTTYTTSGAKTFTTTNAAGCDSVVTLNLTINVATSSSVTQTACGSYLWNGTTYTSSGTYTFNTTNAAGCDSVVILNLTIKNATSSSVTQTACGSYLWNGTTYTSSGTYTFNTTNAAGCDSVVTLNLTINCTNAQYVPPTHVDGAAPNGILWDTVLTGRTLPVRTTTAGFDGVPGAVMFYDKATGKIGINPNGLSLNLVVVTYTSGAVNISSTTAGPFIYPGGTVTNAYSPTTGTPRTFPAPVAVTGLPPTTFRARVALTIGAPLGPALATTGDANNIASTDGFLNRPWSFGSVVNIDSLIANNQALSDSNFKAIGQNSNANANLLGYGPVINNVSPPKGVFHYSINGVAGQQVGAIVFYSSTPTCTAPTLSSRITNQSCSNLNDGAIDLTATGGSPAPTFAWSGPNSFTSTTEDISNLAPGQYTVTATSGTCTSTATYTVNAGSSTQAASVSIASNATANTICAGTSVTFTATPTNGGASPSYQWKLNDNNVGSNISTYTTTSLANNDVVSVVMTSNATCATGSPAVSENITTSVNQPTSSSETQSACGSYLWNGTTYTTSGAKTFTTTNAAGCDSVVTLNLTINSATSSTETITSCGSYTWHGTTYTTSTNSVAVAVGDSYQGGKVAYILQPGDQGYDDNSVKGFIVPITANGHINSSDFGCNSTLINGANSSSIGSGNQNTIDILNGCSDPSAAGSCNTYSVTENNIVYDDWYLPSKEEMRQIALNGGLIGGLQSYWYWTSTQTSSSEAYCVIASSTPSDNIFGKGFDAYRLPIRNFSLLKPTWTGTNAAGCDSVVTLNLTINTTTTSSSTITNCDNYTWNGTTYTTSGAKTFTTTNAAGCDSVVILNLTINALPAKPVVTNGSGCTGSTVTLNATSTSGTVVDWYETLSSTTPLLVASNTFTTPSLSSSTSYYVVARDVTTGCLSSQGSVNNNIALNLDGDNDIVNLPMPVLNSFTIEYWVKSTQASPSGSQWYSGNGIVDAEVGGGTTDFGTALLNDKLAFGVGDPDVTIFSTTSINTGSWNHVAATWNGSTGLMKLYINGTLEASANGATGLRSAPSAIRVGNLLPNINNFNGTIDELRIWNVARTQSEIQENINNELNQQSGLVEAYHFNQGVASGSNSGITTIADASGNNRNGSMLNFTLSGTSSNFVEGSLLNNSRTTVTATINTATSSTETIAGCVSYVWNGVTYTTSGTRTWRGINAAGCDSVATLILTISKSNIYPPFGATQTVVSNVCSSRVYRYTASVNVTGTTYNWILPTSIGGVSGVALDSGNINSSRTILVRYTSNEAAFATDSIKVRTFNGCVSKYTAVKLAIIKLSVPTAPSLITVTSIDANRCSNRRYRFTAPALPAGTNGGIPTYLPATGYLWSLVGSLSEYATIDSGENSQKIVVSFSSNVASVTGDSIKLQYLSSCGNSNARVLKLSNTKLNAPLAPATITIAEIQTNVCGARRYRYTAPNLPVASTNNGAATGYVWSLVGLLSNTATRDSGNVNSRVITVTFTSNAAAATGDSIRLNYTSDCGIGARKASKLINTLLVAPSVPATITMQIKSDVCNARTYRYIAPAVLPVATTTIGAASGYLWSAPTGTVGSTGTIDSGEVTSRIITVTYSSNAAAGVGDSIRLRYTSGCGDGKIKAQKLSNLIKNGCLPISKNVSTSRVPNTLPTSIEVNVYPNPTTSQFNVQVKSSSTEVAVVRVLDYTGRFIKAIKVSSNSNVNLGSDLKAGAYLLEVKQGKEVKMVRVEKF